MIDLKPFCDPYDVQLQSPWNEGGFTYATDKFIVVRVPTNEPDSPPLPGAKRPNVDALFESLLKGAHFIQWPYEQWPMCETCSGRGFTKTKKKCDKCSGSGEHECPRCGSEMECEQCDGSGYVKAHSECDCLAGFTLELNAKKHIAPKYVRLISTLPGVTWRNEDTKILFRFDGMGQGICIAKETK